MVYYHVIAAQHIYVSVSHVFAYLYTLDDNSECPMDYETSLLPKVFPCTQWVTWGLQLHVSFDTAGGGREDIG